jgi:hypothetical protein
VNDVQVKMGAILSQDLDLYALDDPLTMAEIATAVQRLRELDSSGVNPDAVNLAQYQMLFNQAKRPDAVKKTIALSQGKTRAHEQAGKEFEEHKKAREGVFHVFSKRAEEGAELVADPQELLAGSCFFADGAQREKLKVLFQLFDFNDDRCLTPDELREVLVRTTNGVCTVLRQEPPPTKFLVDLSVAAFIGADQDGSNEIDYEEFEHWFAGMMPSITSTRLGKKPGVFDPVLHRDLDTLKNNEWLELASPFGQILGPGMYQIVLTARRGRVGFMCSDKSHHHIRVELLRPKKTDRAASSVLRSAQDDDDGDNDDGDDDDDDDDDDNDDWFVAEESDVSYLDADGADPLEALPRVEHVFIAGEWAPSATIEPDPCTY